MNFKQWLILSEELYTQNNTATIFHRTIFKYVQEMMNNGFRAGAGAYHGPGLYTTYTLEGTTNLGYGDYVVKLKVNNLNNYFVLEPDIAKKIHGNNWKLKDQARILKLTLNLTDEEWEKYQEISESGEFGSAAASQALKYDKHFLWEHGCKGIVYNGEQDGKCICVYAPYEDLQFLAYAYAPAPTTVDFIEKNWIKSGKGVSIRSISDLKFPKNIGITSVEKQYQISDPNLIIPSKILNDVFKGKYVKLKLYLKNNKLTGNNVYHLLVGAPDKEKMAEILGSDNINKINSENVKDLLSAASDKDKMINLIIKYKTEFSGEDVHNLLVGAPDKEKIARILGSDNINKINSENVKYLLSAASNRQEMINLIIKYKTEFSGEDVHNLLSRTSDKEKIARILGQNNIDKLTVGHVHNLLSDASDIEEMGRILRQENIDKLTSGHVHNLLSGASDKEKIARILGQENIEKLTVGHFYDLLSGASDKEKIVEILGPDNINQLSDHHVYYLLSDASDIEEMGRILRQENIDKLTGESVYSLLSRTYNKDQMAKMARILGQNNIDKLNNSGVHNLLYSTPDKEKMAEILGPKNIAKLSSDNAKNQEEMARILGKENIEKIHK